MVKADFQVQRGIYPTMITPYQKNGEIDYEVVEKYYIYNQVDIK